MTENATGPASFPATLARLGRRIFGWRLLVGLLALIPAALFIRPVSWIVLPLGYKVAGLAGVLIGLWLRAWASAHAGGHTRSDTIEAGHLAVSGPYARVRNPIYLGNFILGLGMVALLGDPWLLPLHLLTFIILYSSIVPAEEQFLTRKFGDAYRAYCKQVPRILPRITAWRTHTGGAPRWKHAFGEMRIALLLGVIYFALVFI